MRSSKVLIAAAAVLLAACVTPPKGGHFEKAQAAYAAGDYAKSITHCNDAIRCRMDVARATFLRGKCREKTGDGAAAIADYERAAKLDGTMVEPVLRAARLHLALGATDRARTAVESLFGGRYLSLAARHRVMAHGVYGEVLIAWPDYASAVVELEKGIKFAFDSGLGSDRTTTVLYYNLSRANFGRANYRRARDAFARYLERSSGSAEDQYTMVVLQFLAGDVATARSLAAKLPEELKGSAEQILQGDALSVRALFETQPPKETENP